MSIKNCLTESHSSVGATGRAATGRAATGRAATGRAEVERAGVAISGVGIAEVERAQRLKLKDEEFFSHQNDEKVSCLNPEKNRHYSFLYPANSKFIYFIFRENVFV